MTLDEKIDIFKKDFCEECESKNKCEGIAVTIENKLKCILKNIEEKQ